MNNEKHNNNLEIDETEHKITKPKFKKLTGFPGRNLKGKIKLFDQGLSDNFDRKARIVIKECLGDSIIDNPDIYGEDMIVITDEIPFGYIELQVYGKWTNEIFPYDNPFVYERKMKFCKNTLFICFNNTYTEVILFSRQAIHPNKCRQKKYSREYVHYVPWKNVIKLKIDQLTIKTIRDYYCFGDD